jgi:hypothetical protein
MKPPSWVTSESYWNEQRRRLVACANDLIEGRIGVIEASRQFSYYRSWFRAQDDPDFMTFVAIDSDTDNLPVGAVRQKWAIEVLEKKDIEIQHSEALHRSHATEAARNLVKKYAVNDQE